MSGQVHSQGFQIELEQVTSSTVNSTAVKNAAVESEPHYTTDTKKLYVFDGSNNVRVHGLDLACMYEDEIVSFDNEIVYFNDL